MVIGDLEQRHGHLWTVFYQPESLKSVLDGGDDPNNMMQRRHTMMSWVWMTPRPNCAQNENPLGLSGLDDPVSSQSRASVDVFNESLHCLAACESVHCPLPFEARELHRRRGQRKRYPCPAVGGGFLMALLSDALAPALLRDSDRP